MFLSICTPYLSILVLILVSGTTKIRMRELGFITRFFLYGGRGEVSGQCNLRMELF